MPGRSGEPVSPIDTRLLALAIVLEPAITLARILGLSLDDLQAMVSVGYFRELQLRGLSLRMMTKRLGKSLRTVATLSKRSLEETLPLEGSRRIGWRRTVVRQLAGHSRRSFDEVMRAIPDTTAADFEHELEQLVAEGVVARDGEQLSLAQDHLNLAREDLDHRLESLRHFFHSVAHVVYRRFFGGTAEQEAFARVFTFSVFPSDLRVMREKLYEEIRSAVLEADARAEGKPGAVQGSVTVSFVETPADLPWRSRPAA